ncbi:alpha/beta hydrolase [Candidatus Daviesbacteria bacterium]|nr:alpha/beta hydrolase [Candidatus Daviesbacteria bacterium]
MYVSINNQNIYFQKLGKGPDLIMLHGWGNDVSSFWGISQILKENFTIYLIDLPGFGRSDPPKTAFNIVDYANIIKGFIESQNLKKPDLLGHSLGGRTAIKLASKNPDLLGKLILEASAGIKPKRDLYKTLIYPLAKLAKFIPNIFSIKEKLRYIFYKSLESDYLKAGEMKQTLANILEEDLTEDLSKIKTETLLIWGEKDPTKEASLKNGKKMYQLIKNCRIEVLDNVGHFPHLEQPEKFVQLIKDFCL